MSRRDAFLLIIRLNNDPRVLKLSNKVKTVALYSSAVLGDFFIDTVYNRSSMLTNFERGHTVNVEGR